jgi:hypothetical protein
VHDRDVERPERAVTRYSEVLSVASNARRAQSSLASEDPRARLPEYRQASGYPHLHVPEIAEAIMRTPDRARLDEQRLHAAATRAPEVYPGPVGELVAHELRAWHGLGTRFGGHPLMTRLIDDVLAASRRQKRGAA